MQEKEEWNARPIMQVQLLVKNFLQETLLERLYFFGPPFRLKFLV